jgi:four helix bundle protein
MATFNSFEKIVAWKKARSFSMRVFSITRSGPFAKDFELKDQINGSSGSIMDNIAEGFGRGGNKEFITFLSYARGSSDESRSQLYRAHDRGYIANNTLEELRKESLTIGKAISGLIIYLQKTDIKGSKFMKPNDSDSKSDPDSQ